MAIPKSQKRTPQRIAPGSSTHRFNRSNLGTPLENYRREQVDRLENPENGENFNEEIGQAQNENISQQAQQTSQQTQVKNIAQQQIAWQQKQMAMRLLRQRLRNELIKKQVAGAVAKKAGTSLAVSAAGGVSCTGCITIILYVVVIGAIIAIVGYAAHYLHLI